MTSKDPRPLQAKIWEGCVPLEIRLASNECKTYDQSDAFMILVPRQSYIPLLLPRLHAFFFDSLINEQANSWNGWLSYQDVPMKWHLPIGLLYDLYSGASEQLRDTHDDRPDSSDGQEATQGTRAWKLTLHFQDWPKEALAQLDSEGKVMQDAFTNSVKESSFVRHGSAKVVMALSKDDSTQLWDAVEKNDFARYSAVNQKLLNHPGAALKHVPIKVYLPAASSSDDTAGHLRVVQSLVTPSISARQPQTLGTALNSMLPSLFPSRKNCLIALPVLQGSIVPLGVSIETLAEVAAYADGFLRITVVMR
ncbi:autophagy protein-like protein 5 [Venturia nashicola]|nr:autophagy protein-like protein 5 [Venturia nashicola]